METVSIKKFFRDTGFTTTNNTGEMSFAFINADLEQVSTVTWCRGWQQEAMLASVRNRAYYYLGADKKVDFSRLRIVGVKASDHLAKMIPAIEDFLHQFEDACGIERTVIKEMENTTGSIRAFYFEGSEAWMSFPMYSLFCLLVRRIEHQEAHELGASWKIAAEKVLADATYKLVLNIAKYSPKVIFPLDNEEYLKLCDNGDTYHDFGIDKIANKSTGGLPEGLRNISIQAYATIDKLEKAKVVMAKERVTGVLRRRKPTAYSDYAESMRMAESI